jgi:hypothetical protein
MKPIKQRSMIKQRSIALAVALAFTALAVAGGSASASTSQQIITGRVLKIDIKQRQMLVAARSSKRLYLVNVPDEARLKILFGRNMQLSEAALEDVDINNVVWLRCAREDKEHYSRLQDGREVTVLRAAH